MFSLGLKREEIDVVEIVGGSSRIPALRAIFEKVFNKPCSTTLNQDEAVVRGCAIQCAMLSHTVKVRDIDMMDAASYPIHIAWDCTKTEEQYGEMEVFKKHHSYPFTKLLTFPHRVEPFCFRAYYNKGVKIPHLSGEIGKILIQWHEMSLDITRALKSPWIFPNFFNLFTGFSKYFFLLKMSSNSLKFRSIGPCDD